MNSISDVQLFPGNDAVERWEGRIPSGELSTIARQAAQGGGFTNIRVSRMGETAKQLSAVKQTSFVAIPGSRQTQLQVRWQTKGPQRDTVIQWFGYSQLTSGGQVPDWSSMHIFGKHLREQLEFVAASWEPPPKIPYNPVVKPGERVPTEYKGEIKDYSRFLPMEELARLGHGVLPLGTAAFGWEPHVQRGPALFMPTLEGGVPAEQYGVLLCAPPGSGKTHLLGRWAAAAAMNGTSVFAIDVKGTLRSVLEKQFRRAGASIKIREFTTDANVSSDRCNFLAGLRADDPECVTQLNLLAEALLLPIKDDRGWKHVARGMLAAVLKMGKLIEWHAPEHLTGGCLDLSQLLPVVHSERELRRWLTFVYQMETWPDAKPARITAAECGHALSLAIDRSWKLAASEEEGAVVAVGEVEDEDLLLQGERTAESSFQQYMWSLQLALDPYRASGTVGPRIASSGEREEIRLDEIGILGPPSVTIVTVPMTADPTDEVILMTVMRLLCHHLDKRRLQDEGATGKLLLLFDETVRIQGFDPVRFTSISRDNRVGYVFVYQSLSFIEPEKQLAALMSNIGTQIYLKQVAGDDLTLFNRQFYQPSEVKIGTSWTKASDDATKTKSEHFLKSDFLSAIAAKELPGGRRPAVIYIRDLNSPFITDLHDDGAVAANG